MNERMKIRDDNKARAFSFIIEKIAERIMRDTQTAAQDAFELAYVSLVDEENNEFHDLDLLDLSLQGIDELANEIVRDLQEIEE
jgi:hypothetical protein